MQEEGRTITRSGFKEVPTTTSSAKRQQAHHKRFFNLSLDLFGESIFQDPCRTLNGTRRVTMPQVLTRRSGPITQSRSVTGTYKPQELALLAITQEAEAHSLLLSPASLSLLGLTHHKRTKRNLLSWKCPKALLLLPYCPLPFVPEREHTAPNELELLDARW